MLNMNLTLYHFGLIFDTIPSHETRRVCRFYDGGFTIIPSQRSSTETQLTDHNHYYAKWVIRGVMTIVVEHLSILYTLRDRQILRVVTNRIEIEDIIGFAICNLCDPFTLTNLRMVANTSSTVPYYEANVSHFYSFALRKLFVCIYTRLWRRVLSYLPALHVVCWCTEDSCLFTYLQGCVFIFCAMETQAQAGINVLLHCMYYYSICY